MTDDEILFDLLTVEASLERPSVGDDGDTDPGTWSDTTAPMSPLPGMQPGRQTSTMQVTSDREEFIRWYEAEVGPWQTTV